MKCCRCGNETTTGDPGETLCVGCYEVYKATYPPTPDPIDHAFVQLDHATPPRLTDEEVWLRAWEAAVCRPNDNQTVCDWADACLAAFRERFRQEDGA